MRGLYVGDEVSKAGQDERDGWYFCGESRFRPCRPYSLELICQVGVDLARDQRPLQRVTVGTWISRWVRLLDVLDCCVDLMGNMLSIFILICLENHFLLRPMLFYINVYFSL